MRPHGRATYAVQPGPGSIRTSPEDVGAGDETEARAAFCVIALTYDRLEYLTLAKDGHRRARFTWRDGALASEWLVP